MDVKDKVLYVMRKRKSIEEEPCGLDLEDMPLGD